MGREASLIVRCRIDRCFKERSGLFVEHEVLSLEAPLIVFRVAEHLGNNSCVGSGAVHDPFCEKCSAGGLNSIENISGKCSAGSPDFIEGGIITWDIVSLIVSFHQRSCLILRYSCDCGDPAPKTEGRAVHSCILSQRDGVGHRVQNAGCGHVHCKFPAGVRLDPLYFVLADHANVFDTVDFTDSFELEYIFKIVICETYDQLSGPLERNAQLAGDRVEFLVALDRALSPQAARPVCEAGVKHACIAAGISGRHIKLFFKNESF